MNSLNSETLTVAQGKAHYSQPQHLDDSLRAPFVPSTSPSPVCLSVEGAKNVLNVLKTISPASGMGRSERETCLVCVSMCRTNLKF